VAEKARREEENNSSVRDIPSVKEREFLINKVVNGFSVPFILETLEQRDK
jgi:hypothetical protein